MKRFLKTTVSTALLASCLCASALGLSACGGKSQAGEAPSDTRITRLRPPADGSLPTAHTAQENLAYLAYVLDSQPQYHCYTYTVTQASIATQYTKSYKDYRDGVTISSDITYSSMVKSGSQACFVNGAAGPEVYMRYSSAPDSQTTNLTAGWDSGRPYYFDEQSYLTTYGLLQSEMTNYIINELTITDGTAAEDNGDGTYTQYVTLDPVASTYYYQYGMKTRGGLNGFPEFQSVGLTFTFDAQWRVLSIETDEVAKVNKGVTVTSTTRSVAEYSYDPSAFDEAHYAYYNDYFKQYVGDSDLSAGGGAPALDAAGVLSGGFAQVLNGGQQFEVSLTLGQREYKGYVFLGLDLADPANSLALKLSLGKTLRDQSFYAEYSDGSFRAYYGENFGVAADIAALRLVADDFAEWARSLNAALSPGGQGSSGGGITVPEGALDELLGSFVLTTGEGTAELVLEQDDLLGLGVGLNVEMQFSVGEDGSVSFSSARVDGVGFGGEGIDLALSLAATDAPVIDRESTSAEADLSLYAADVFRLLSSDLVRVGVSLDGSAQGVAIAALKGLNAQVVALVDANGLAAGAEADLSYTYGGDVLSAHVVAYYDYSPQNYGNITVAVTSLCGKPVDLGVSCAADELGDAVGALLGMAGIRADGLLADAAGLNGLADILNNVLAADFSAMISDLYADGARISLRCDLDMLLGLFGIDGSFGTLGLAYDYGGCLSASLPALGLDVSVEGAEGELLPPEEQALDFADLVAAVSGAYQAISDIAEEGRLNVVIPAGGNTVAYNGVRLDVTGSVSAAWKGDARVAADLKVKLAGAADEAATDVKFIYNRTTDADVPLVRLYINGAALDIYAADFAGVQSQISTLAAASSGDSVVGALIALLADGAWVDFINDLTLTADGQSLALSYLDGAASVEVSSQGGLGLKLSAQSGAFSCEGRMEVVEADVYAYVDRQIDKASPLSTKDGHGFAEVVYDYIFDAFNAVDLADVLGGEYSVDLSLNGDNSSIAALKGVRLNANLAFGEYDEERNAAAADVWLSVNGVEVKFNITLIGERFYVAVTNITGRDIPGLKLTCTADSLYELLTDLAETAVQSGVLGGAYSAPSAQTRVAVTDILYALATADLDSFIAVAPSGDGGTVVVDVDGLLNGLGADAGFIVGAVTAELGDGRFRVRACVAGREWLSLSAGISQADFSGVVLSDYINFDNVTSIPLADILNLLNGRALGISLDVSHSFGAHAVDAEAEVYLTLDGSKAAARISLAYSYKGAPVSAELSAYFEEGTVWLLVTSLNGGACELGVSCNVADTAQAAERLFAALGFDLEGGAADLGASVSGIVDGLLNADYPSIVSGVYSDEVNGLGADIDADALFAAMGLGDPGFGVVRLNFLGGVLRAECGDALSLTLSGAELSDVVRPEISGCVELSDLIDFVASAYAHIDGIINSQSLAFEIDADDPARIAVDGISASLSGRGEISWAQTAPYVALDLSLSLAEGVAADELEFVLVYDGSAAGDRPFITFSVNGVGMAVSRADVAGAQDKLAAIADAVKPLLGGLSAQPAALSRSAGGASADDLVCALLGALSKADLAGLLNALTVTVDGESLALGWADDNFVAVSAGQDGLKLALSAAAQGDGVSVAAGASVTASRACGALRGELEEELAGGGHNIVSAADGQSFLKLAFDFLFEAVRSISVEDILASRVYGVSFSLDGSLSGEERLKDVFVDAEMYVKNNSRGDTVMQLCLDVNVGGAVVKGSVVIDNDSKGHNTDFYIDLSRVLNVTLNGLKVKASQDTLYGTLSSLVDLVCDTDILQKLSSLTGGGQPAAAGAAPRLSSGQRSALADVLYSLLTADLSSAVACVTSGGVTNAVVDLDAIASALGLSVGSLGTAQCRIDHANHSVSSHALAPGQTSPWLTLSSQRMTESQITDFNYALRDLDTAEYIDIAFLPRLIDDVRLAVTDDGGNMRESITFSGGTLTAKLVSILEIKIQNLSVTANLSAGDVYFALQGDLSGSLVSKRAIGLTYHNGYLTLYRGVNGGEYRVMTFEYFIDNLFADGEKSTLNWLLGISDFMWGIVVAAVPAGDINSGISVPGELYLYERDDGKAEEEISVTDYVKALSAVVGGRELLSFAADGADVNAMLGSLGLSADDNHYAFELNAPLLTDGVLTSLGAALTRSDADGIDGLLAYGSIQSYVSFTLSLGRSDDAAALGSHFAATEEAFNAATGGGAVTDGNGGVFGCFNSADGSVDFSYPLTPYTLTVADENGATLKSYTVRSGSTVYLYDNYHPVWTDESRQFRQVYLKDGLLCASFEMTGDVTVTAVRRAAIDFTVSNTLSPSQNFVYHSFSGDTLPAAFNGFAAVNAFTFAATGAPVAGTVVSADTPREIVGAYAYETRTVNYVDYAFSADLGGYAAVGPAAGFTQYYVLGNRTLVLENEIDGVPVVAIADGAFANDGADIAKSIRDVVVPENITYVGGGAFLDNTGMRTAVFLAPEVYFAGDDKQVPFYGCSAEKDGQTTLLNVYYRSASSQGDWTYFRTGNRYIGSDGGSLRSGDWTYADGVEISDGGLLDGVMIDGMTFAERAALVFASGVVVDEEREQRCAEYAAALQEIVDAYTLAQSGMTNVYVLSVSLGGGARNSFVVSAEQGVPVSNLPVNVVSRVNFSYGATQYVFSAEAGYAAQVMMEVNGSVINAKTPVASGYVFLGWAADCGDGLRFTELSDPSLTYYAVWAAEREGVAYSVMTSGDSLAQPQVSSGSFEGWYADESFAKPVSSVISAENTVFAARRQFTFSYTVSGNLITKISDSAFGTVSGKSSVTRSLAIKEGQSAAVRVTGSHTAEILVDGAVCSTVTLEKYFMVQYSFKTDGGDLSGGAWSADNVGADVSVSIKY